jgi:arylsulfatase
MPHVPLFVSDKFKGKTELGLYGDVIAEIDWSVGQVMETLDKHNVRDNTIVIFTSDNGPWLSYGDHSGVTAGLKEGKGTSWEGGVRVPCIMRWPNRIPAGRTCDETLMTIDLMPTLAHLTSSSLPNHTIDGLNIWPILSNSNNATNPHEGYVIYYNKNDLQAVISGQWKLVLPHAYRTLNGRPGGSEGKPVNYDMAKATLGLYDLANDKFENTDVSAAHPDIVAKLQLIAERYRAELGDDLTKRAPTKVRPAGKVE